MNLPTTSPHTSILTQQLFTSNHGKKIPAIAMDVDDDGQRIADRIQDKDIKDTTLDNPHQASTNLANPEPPLQDQVAPGAQSTPVRENSTEKDGGAQPPPKQMRKTPPLTLPNPPLVEHGLTLESRGSISTTDPATHAKPHFLVWPPAARSYCRKNGSSHRREDQQDEKIL